MTVTGYRVRDAHGRTHDLDPADVEPILTWPHPLPQAYRCRIDGHVQYIPAHDVLIGHNPDLVPDKDEVLVRAGSARRREALVLAGHERSTSANQHRRSEAVHGLDLGR